MTVQTADSKKEAIQQIYDAYEKRVVILDCPSRASDATAAIAAMSTLTVFPLVPGKKDSYLTLATMHKVIAEGVAPEQLAIVLTRCQTDAEIRDIVAWLKDNSTYSSRFGIITPALLEKPAYRNAIARGLSITEVPPLQLRQRARAVVNAIIARFSMLEDGAIPTPQESAA